jgi:hypothetical protein
MSERPWCEYGRQGKPITPRQLARLLKPFGIISRQIWKTEEDQQKRLRTRAVRSGVVPIR